MHGIACGLVWINYKFNKCELVRDALFCSHSYLADKKGMSKVCEICGRGPQSGNSRSHSNIATRRKFSVNLQTKKIGGQRKKVCASCIKSINKIK